MSTQTMDMPADTLTAQNPETDDASPSSSATIAPATPELAPTRTPWTSRRWAAFLPCVTGAIALAAHQFVATQQSTDVTGIYRKVLIATIAIGAVLGVAALARVRVRPLPWAISAAPILAAGALLMCGWDLITLKFNLLPLPYFPGPDGVFQTLLDDWRGAGQGQPGLAECIYHSLVLLLGGYLTGSVLGIICGVVIGWFAPARYWGMPILKLVGPIPATALIPMSLMLFPSPLLSAVSLIALAVWFPVTMLTLSGVSNTRASYLDVARTLGAKQRYLVLRVAIPAAMPSIFVGLFMGLGASFLTLIVAEAVGVQAGLGWYIDWARAYSDYRKVYAALIIMSVFFSTIMTILFKLRDRVLVWQKGTIKW
jgi:NitT/TauT family transport system permease protein